jgi:branched-subunit amino acid ABC-type transport system permease component
LDLITSFFLSIALGNLLAVMASGVSLTYAVMRFSNFAHGELVTIGAYTSYLAYYFLGQPPLYVCIVPAFIIGALAAVVLHFIMFRPLTKRKANLTTLLVGSIGISFAYKYTLYILTDLQGVWTFVPGSYIGVPVVGGPGPVIIGYLFGFPVDDFFIYSIVAAAQKASQLSVGRIH